MGVWTYDRWNESMTGWINVWKGERIYDRVYKLVNELIYIRVREPKTGCIIISTIECMNPWQGVWTYDRVCELMTRCMNLWQRAWTYDWLYELITGCMNIWWMNLQHRAWTYDRVHEPMTGRMNLRQDAWSHEIVHDDSAVSHRQDATTQLFISLHPYNTSYY